MSFAEKEITVNFALASGQFAGGGNTATVSGLRVQAQIETVATSPAFGTMALAIYGMPLETMQQLATVGPDWSQRYKNEIEVLAGDVGSPSLIFTGVIYNAYVDGADQPDVCLRVQAGPGSFVQVQPATPVSINGSADVAGILQKLAQQMGFRFENNGVQVKLESPYYWGSAWQMAIQVAQDANINMAIERGVMAITPRDAPRNGAPVPVGPLTGMIGYPAFVQNRLLVRALFNPDVQVIGLIDVTSQLQPACGTWKVIKISYDLDTVTANGAWFMSIEAIPPGST